MQQGADNVRLQAHERAVTRLRDIEREIGQLLRSALTPAENSAPPGMRELAYAEGLRAERDQVQEEAKRLEAELFEEMMRRLSRSMPTDSVK